MAEPPATEPPQPPDPPATAPPTVPSTGGSSSDGEVAPTVQDDGDIEATARDDEVADGGGDGGEEAAGEREPAKRRAPVWSRLLVALGSVLIVLSGSTMVAVKLILDETVGRIDQVQIPVGNDDKSVVVRGKALTGPLNILLVGVDDGQAPGSELRTDSARADSIMILHVPRTHDQGYLVSLPRDLWVRIPPFDKTGYDGGSGKLNSVYTIGYGPVRGGGPGRAGGLELLMKTINEATGVTFNAAAIVNFNGFIKAVDLLGGVTMYIDERVESVHYGTDSRGRPCRPADFDEEFHAVPIPGCHPRVFERGTRHLTAEEALDYTRQREWLELEDGDYGRQRHQQQFIKALVREARAQGLTSDLPRTLQLIQAVGDALTVWTNNESLEDWFFTLKDIAGADVVMVKTNNGRYHPADIPGTAAERLSELSREMFAALRTEKIHEFLLQHPDWAATDQ